MLEIIIQQATVPVVVELASVFPAMPRRRWKWGPTRFSEYGDSRRGRSRQHGEGISLAVEAGLLARQSGPGSRSHLLMPPAR